MLPFPEFYKREQTIIIMCSIVQFILVTKKKSGHSETPEFLGAGEDEFEVLLINCFSLLHIYVLGYDVKLHPAVLHLLSSLCRSLRRSLAPLRYW